MARAIVAAEAAAAAREKGAADQAPKAAISQQKNQLFKKIYLFLVHMEPSQLERISVAAASISFTQICWISKLASTRILMGM